MDINLLINEIRSLLTTTFQEVELWFEKDEIIRQYSPKDGGWNINQILEHIALTNHFLLILIEKGTRKALQTAAKKDVNISPLASHVFNYEKLNEIGMHKSFNWMRPEHMEPHGDKTQNEIKRILETQLNQCIDCLNQLKNGEGFFYSTTMSVNNLGKINVYEYIYFLGQHACRHLTQMEKNEREFLELSKQIQY